MTVDLPFTMEFVVYLTNKCNLRCAMCTQYGDNYKENAKQDMPLEDWKKFFDSISDTNPKPKIILIGGEPLLYKDFDALVEYLSELKFNIHLVTNGVFLDKHIDIIRKTEMNITISIDGLENTHDKIRAVSGTFKKVIENIRLINRLKSEGTNISLFVNYVVLPDNIDEMHDFAKFIQTQGINQIVFQHLQSFPEEFNDSSEKEWSTRLGFSFSNGFVPPKSFSFNDEFIEKLYKTLDELSDVLEIEGFIFPYLTKEEAYKYYFNKDLKTIRPYLRCAVPWLTAFISPQGDVSNCIECTLGNIKDNDFWDLWNSDKANKFRSDLCQNGNYTFCAKCCNFYKNNFLYAKDAKLTLNGKQIRLPAELNYLKPAPDGVFIIDEEKSKLSDTTFCYPTEIYSNEMLNEILKKYKIAGKFSDMI